MAPTTVLDDTLLRSKNQFGLSLLVILSWLAGADGDVSPDQARALRTIGAERNDPGEIDTAIAVGAEGHVGDLQLACELIRPLSWRNRRLFLQLAIGIALADGVLAVPQNHILRFLADLVGLGIGGLHAVFREMTGTAFPAPGDPSAPEWWRDDTRRRWRRRQRRRRRESEPRGEGRRRRDAGADAGEAPRPPPPAVDPQRRLDLAVLGLGEEANADEIRMAYRRMAQIHHPDRFWSLGQEAVRAAEVTFKRVRAAYDRLKE